MTEREADRQQLATAALLRAGLNLPNTLTLSRILIVPLLVVVLLTKIDGWEFIGLGLFLVASLTDFLDGFLARRRVSFAAAVVMSSAKACQSDASIFPDSLMTVETPSALAMMVQVRVSPAKRVHWAW